MLWQPGLRRHRQQSGCSPPCRCGARSRRWPTLPRHAADRCTPRCTARSPSARWRSRTSSTPWRGCSRSSRRASLFGALRALEAALGRKPPRERWGPRRIDLDLLLFDAAALRDRRAAAAASRDSAAQFRSVSSARSGARSDRAGLRARRRACRTRRSQRASGVWTTSRSRMAPEISAAPLHRDRGADRGRQDHARDPSWPRRLGAELVLERADENPFLERFYRNPRAGALPAQLYFLFSARAAARGAQAAGPVRAAARRRLPDRQGSAVRAHHAR